VSGAEWWTQRAGLDGTVALVTGGAGGLGAAITLDLQANGCNVAVVDRDPDAAASLTAALDACGADTIVHVGDAREPEVLDALFAATADRWGRLDTLVNVVGGTFRGEFADSTPTAWDALLRTNLLHVLHACSRAIPAIRAGGRGGSIINLTTIEGHRAAPGFAVYSAAKAAVAQFARSLAIELAPDAIRVNCVAPDMTPTENMMRLAGGAETQLSHPLGPQVSIPMGRVGTPQDVAGAVVFLASRLSEYVTGTTIHPDGGTYAASGWFNWPESGFGNTVPLDVLRLLEGPAG